jgi:hypothetical protein
MQDGMLVRMRDRLLCHLLVCALTAVLFAAEQAAGVTGSNAPPRVSPTFTAGEPNGPACPATSGPLTLKVSTVRNAGISPFLVFFDATGTVDTSITGNTTAFQDVTYTWTFGDTGVSGTGSWPYGSNPGHNSRNTATGGIAAHLYINSGTDTTYTATVTATDGTHTASCQVPVTAYDPAGVKGFAGTKTTCVAASGTPVAGSGGCPAGAAVLKTPSFAIATGSSHIGSGKRVLFHCGDTFTGGGSLVSGIKWSIGAYGGCEGTQTKRPIVSGGGVDISMQATGDGRVSDLDFESVGSGNSAVLSSNNYDYVAYQITLDNLLSNGNNTSYYMAQCAQCGYIELVQTGMGANIGTFINFAENNQGQWGTNSLYNNIDYQAMIGGSYNGAGAPNNGNGIETVRVSACRLCVFENNTMENANNIGAVLKLHDGNTKNSAAAWSGVYVEFIEISDNLFTGTSGAQLVETAPQNGGTDERLRNIVLERNLFSGSTGAQGGRQAMVSAVNATLRDNVFYMPGTAAQFPYYGAQIAQRGVEPAPSAVEVYNNTCYAPNGISGQSCIGLDGLGMHGSALNSFAKNNLFYITAAGHSTVVNTGKGNTLANNTSMPAGDPAFTNGSGSFSVISDFKPTSNFAGGASAPVWYDALGVPWSPSWDLGAVHH